MQEDNTIIKLKGKKPKTKISLLTLLANTRTAQARRLLKKHGQADAKNYDELALKLAELYQGSNEKVAIEKEFAEMHPHKELILRNLAPKPIPVEEKVNFTQTETDNLHRNFINKDGTSNSIFSNACGCGSGFDDNASNPKGQISQIKEFIGPILIVFVMGMTMYAILSINKKNGN